MHLSISCISADQYHTRNPTPEDETLEDCDDASCGSADHVCEDGYNPYLSMGSHLCSDPCQDADNEVGDDVLALLGPMQAAIMAGSHSRFQASC